jgi:dihydroxyacetone kinase
MRATITTADLLAVLKEMAPDMVGHKDHFCQLDAAMGGGDQGVTMAIGFQAIASAIEALSGQDIGTIVTKSGLAFNGAAASTIGSFFATACMRAGREVKGKAEIGVADLANMMEAAFAGIQERGKAQVGDKTVLDALAPTAQALRAAADVGAPLPDALRAALAAAEKGLRATIP